MKKSGFTLVELLVAISIIAVLSVIGITVFSGVQKNARDAKRRADIDAIKKAYMSYIGPGSTDGSSLPGQTSNTNTAYKVCATLSDNKSSCATSNQGDTSVITQINSLANTSCDPTGSLAFRAVFLEFTHYLGT